MTATRPPNDLVVSDLHVRYGKVAAVRGVSLAVPRGSVVALIGANGAGKSSTLNALCGNIRATITGEVMLLGRPVTRMKAHSIVQQGMVLVPEGREIIAPLSVAENLALAGYGGRAGGKAPALMEEVYGLFPILAERRSTAGGMLSGGEQQMLAFGRAIMAAPDIIVMDEPSMGLSPLMVEFIMGSISRIRQRGVTVLLVEQNASAAFEIADYVYVMEQGQVTQEGSAAELRTDPRVAESFLGLRAHRARRPG